jgi:hypothetical protein
MPWVGGTDEAVRDEEVARARTCQGGKKNVVSCPMSIKSAGGL